ncbi:MAG: glycosyltransferase family 8 protein [Lachnospiraceae bacterium]|nr:glycosyltransferase family 8 protein [Lachnospiraceae bacterium]
MNRMECIKVCIPHGEAAGKMKEQLNVVYASNDGYARHLGASLCSLYDRNLEEKELQVYVLSMGLTEESRVALETIAENYGRELIFIDMDDLEARFGHPVDLGGYDISIMLRLFIGEVLPREVERVLYLDCDTIVAQSLKKLWEEDLEGCIIGAVMEPTIYLEVKESIGLESRDPYYNSGVLLVDLKRWREEGIQQRLLDFWKSKDGKLFASDQDVLNGTLKGQIHTLMPRYNFFTNYRYFSYAQLLGHAPTYEAVSQDQFVLAKKHPTIIHYMGDERPWIAGNLNHYRRAYDKYLAMTPWAGAPREKGKRRYMAAYHLLDYTTVVCPAVRWTISRKLGMKLVESRKERTS